MNFQLKFHPKYLNWFFVMLILINFLLIFIIVIIFFQALIIQLKTHQSFVTMAPPW